MLQENNITYYEYGIESSAEGRSQYDKLGARGIPVLKINGQIVKGYNPQKILALAGK